MNIFSSRKEKKEEARRQAEEEARRQAEEAAKLEAKAKADAARSSQEKAAADMEMEKKAYSLAMNAGRYAEAIDHLENLGQMGDADAYNAIAKLYYQGEVVEKSPEKVFEYSKKSMELGSGSGAMLVALSYHSGRGVKQDRRKALEAIHIALDRKTEGAERLYDQMIADCAEADTDETAAHAFMDGTALAGEGNSDQFISLMKIVYELHSERYSGSGAFSLYLAYRDGDGVPKDMAEAKKWLMRAAEFGLAEDNGPLAYELYKNAETLDDLRFALEWAETAKRSVQSDSDKGRAVMSLVELLRDKIDAGEAVAAYNAGKYSQALPMFRALGEKGNPGAAYYTARMYLDGKGTERYRAEGMRWMEKAAELGSGGACLYLAGHFFTDREDGDQIADPEKALYWAEKARDSGELDGAHLEAANKMIELLTADTALDEAVEVFNSGERERGIEMLEAAADNGSAAAMAVLGEVYGENENDRQPWQDDKKALKWYRKAAENGVSKVYYPLVVLIMKTASTAAEYDEALKWAELAADDTDDGEGLAALTDEIRRRRDRRLAEESYKTGELEKSYLTYTSMAESEQLDNDGLFRLGGMAYRGAGTEQSWEKALKWWQKAAERGSIPAMTAIAESYINGTVAPKDRKKALYWAQRAIQTKGLDEDARGRLNDIIARINQY